MAFDSETDDVHLLRCVVQLLRTSAAQTLERTDKIRTCAGQVKVSAASIENEAETLLTELNRLLTQARTALAGVVAAVRDDVA